MGTNIKKSHQEKLVGNGYSPLSLNDRVLRNSFINEEKKNIVVLKSVVKDTNQRDEDFLCFTQKNYHSLMVLFNSGYSLNVQISSKNTKSNRSTRFKTYKVSDLVPTGSVRSKGKTPAQTVYRYRMDKEHIVMSYKSHAALSIPKPSNYVATPIVEVA